MFDKFEKLKNYLAGAELKEGTFTPTPLSAHDKQFHPNGYKPGDECAFREAAAQRDIADMLLTSTNSNAESNPKDTPSATTSSCPLLSHPIGRCDFATKFDRNKTLKTLLSALTQADPDQKEKFHTLLEGQFSWCALQLSAREIFSALTYGVTWIRFKTLNQSHWVEIQTVAKCLFAMDEMALEQVFSLREQIVNRLVHTH